MPWSWKGRAIPLLPLWAVRPVQSLSACTRVTFTFLPYKGYGWRVPGVASYTSFRSRILWSMWGKSHVLAKLDNYFLYYITPCCRNELFCVITQRVATITTYRRFGTTYLSHLQVSSSTFWLLKTGPDRLSRNVGNYLTSLHCLSSQKPQNKSTARQKPNLYYSY